MFIRLMFVGLLLLLPFSNALAAERRTPVVEAVAKARDAVVNIRTEEIVRQRSSPFFGFGDSIFEQFFNDMLSPRSYKTQSLGSGVIIDAQGYILTNAHVVEKASKIFVALTEKNQELEAKLIGMDERIDLAVLKIEQQGNYPYLQPARSDDLLLGESVIAIGNPLGLGHSITTGIISSTKRHVQLDKNFSSVFIQTDALINPGNSGGPLININGELIGINTAIARQAQGIGFSIPINTAKRVLNDLIEYGRVRRAYFGVVPAEVSSNFTHSYGEGGVLIEELLDDSPAEKAGFQIADVILTIDGVEVRSLEEYYSLLQTYTPGDKLNVFLLRGLQMQEKSVLLTTLPKGYELSYTLQNFGFSLKEGQRGLFIDRVVDGSAADKIGLKLGDQIAKVDGIAIETLSDYEAVITERIGRLPLTFLVARNNRGYLIELP
ncbi:trypsin-like peptidase domain-containing protein [Malonomonas rubra]|uniref:trypsin-like peptidase domain-containing protein n=1 Tax=Malonomonas rubra TaxID=57040 RepID=UPI0026F134C4|nr:trypsin-like peptidase domain-containing protein [Malonomonas rubra]